MLKPLCHKTDQQLIEQLSHAEHAFTEIYNRYWDKLLYIAAIKLKNITIAEEIVQDVFLDLWKRRKQLAITGSLEAYLSVAVKYRIINAHARIKREQDYLNNRAIEQLHTEPWLDERELQKNYKKLVSQLPEKCRITYQLSREEGLSLKEIAGKMSVSQKAVEANLTRSLKLLRIGLKKILFTLLYWVLAANNSIFL